MKPYEQATSSLSTLDQLDQIGMSPDRRRIARASMRQAEMIAETLMRAHADLRQVLGFVRRLVSPPARRSKLPAVRPEPN